MKERRKESRMGLGIPIVVQGHDPGGGKPWDEMTKSVNASFGGVAFFLKHRAEVGQVVLLRLPLPKQFRQYALTEQSYSVYSLIRGVTPGSPSVIGVMFLGKNPPRGWDKNPGGRYFLPTDRPPQVPKERRRWKRLENIFLNVRLRRPLNPQVAEEEITVAENIGKGGVRVMTAVIVPAGVILELEELGGDFRSRAEVKGTFLGKDNVPRLNLAFLDAEAPDRLIS